MGGTSYQWRTAMGQIVYKIPAIYNWNILLSSTNLRRMKIGVCDYQVHGHTQVAHTQPRSWAYFLYGHCLVQNGVVTHNDYGPEMKSGDTVGVSLNLSDNTITFFHNDKSLGIAFAQVKGPVSPFVDLQSRHERFYEEGGGEV